MIVLAGTQILLRNLFDSGFVWIDPLLRVMVLWLGLLGATVATRQDKHIRIDLLSRQFKRNTMRLLLVGVSQVSAWTCLVIGWYGMGWIYAIGAIAGGAYFVIACVRLHAAPGISNAWRAFGASIAQLGLLLVAAMLDGLLVG